MFSTPENSVLFCQEMILRIRVFPEALAWDRAKPPERVLFNISVEPTIFGAPVECIPHIIWISLLFLSFPFVTRYVHTEIFIRAHNLKQKL